MADTYIHYSNVEVIPAKDETANLYFTQVIGNKTDVAAATADTTSLVGLVRYIIANMPSDADVAALIGALNTAAHTGVVDNTTTVVGYLKQLVTSELAIKGAGWSNENLTTIDANVDSILTAAGTTIPTLIGTPVTDIATDIASIVTLIGTPAVDLITDLNALIGTPATSISADIAAIKTVVDTIDDYVDAEVAAIKAKTDTIGILVNTGGTATLASIIGDVANIDLVTRIDTIDNFLDTEIAAIKLVTDALPDAGALTSLAQDLTVAKEATLGVPVVDLATDIATNLTNIGDASGDTLVSVNAKIGDVASSLATLIGTPATSISADIASVYATSSRIVSVQTPDATATPWTIGPHRLFSASGVVEIVKIYATVKETVVEGAGADNTLSVGTANDVDMMIGITAGNALVKNDIWSKITPAHTSKYTVLANNESFIIEDVDIDLNVLGTNPIVDGTIKFFVEWKPCETGATVTAAVWD